MAGIALAGAMAGRPCLRRRVITAATCWCACRGRILNFNDESTDLTCRRVRLELDDEFIPTLTLTYFLNKNLAVELFCCFANLDARICTGTTKVADFWVFPPALTLQYHFDSMGGFKPYVGVGLQYIAPFSEDGVGRCLPG